ncbi:uncharacterized protein LOC132111056 [Carassius carassius]|uniref:uncharacterized protein LOC132111056 n=1 Tax=Carassius carassius TaxID=217509 RepID=UPI002868E22E|nr:uncharacterized protein LOC132111056 [Carassius carassius]
MFRQNSDPVRGPRRRRVQTRHVTFRVGLILLPDLETFHAQKVAAIKKIQVPLSLSAEEFLDVLKTAFPRLGSTDFDLARVDCNKKIRRLNVSPLSPSVLKASKELNRSALYLLPKERLEGQAEEQQEECHDEGSDSGQRLDQDDVQVVDTSDSLRPHTMERDELREWRALRESQDEEYLSSLRADQDRVSNYRPSQRREADLEKRRKEALERRRLSLSRLAEPQDGIPLQLKYPDGHIIRRRFYLTHPIQHLFDFVGSDEMATEEFFIQRAMAPRIRSTTTSMSPAPFL